MPTHRLARALCFSLTVAVTLLAASLCTPALAKKMPTPPPPEAAPQTPNFWEATLTLPDGNTLAISFFISQDPSGAWTGTINIPAQMVEGMPLSAVTVSGDTLSWAMPLPKVPEASWPRAALTLSPDRQAASGTFTQGPAKLPISASASSPLKLRPQTPQPPFPYTSRDVTFSNTSDPAHPVTLAGTLTTPPGDGPFPAVILITGSGIQDRDETIFGHKPFWVLADHLSRLGVAVLRVDDRGAGGSSPGDLANATTLTLATDADAALDFLKAQPHIDPKRLGAIGHSEGGVIAILLASRRPDVAFSVLLASSAVPGFDILLRQNADTFLALGASPAQATAVSDAQRVVLQAVLDGKDDATILPLITSLIQTQITASGAPSLSPEQAADAAKVHLPSLRSPWMLTFLTLDPRQHLPNIKTPILALNGTLDTQVAHEPNLAAIRAATDASGNKAVSLHPLPNLNHLFQTAKTGHVGEYATITETFSPSALSLISDWILKQPPLP